MQDYDLDERDLRLLHALQIRPRAPWAALAPIVGADAVTLARRWKVLREAGLAWVTSYQGTGTRYSGAIVEIDCAPASILRATEELAGDQEVLSIDQTAGGRDLVVTVLCRTEADLGHFLLERLCTVEGIRSTRTHRSIKLLTDAKQWRLRSLQGDEARLLERNLPQPASTGRGITAEHEKHLASLLRADGRASIAKISGVLDISPAKARNAVSTVIAEERLVLRLEVARSYTPWPVCVWYFMRVPATKVEVVARRLSGLEEVRLVTTTGGMYSIIMSVWLRRVEDMTVLERQLGERLPFAEIMDRSIVLRTPKHMGHRLDPSGKRTS
ncbi:Lrp/AsnC family transcriptional regulator [Paenarthrobacter sp. YAF11_1]|uniref:Lrp/AsnC family transcriptional regulator n=1 Tax=Micrococcaceae TaxID=1268 RepID=UPI0028830AB0|nr:MULTISPECIES: Lrp/AsnC family transcriptional regulator [unclassified Arthrobacter]